MRRIFTSPRLENVERVAALLKEHGVEARITNGRSYKGNRRGNFSYRDDTRTDPQPAVWIVRPDDQPKARALMREAGLLDSGRSPTSFLATEALLHPGDTDSGNASKRRMLLIKSALLVGIIVAVGAGLFAWRKPALPTATAPAVTPPIPVIEEAITPERPTVGTNAEVIYRADVPSALAAMLIAAELRAHDTADVCLAVDGAAPSKPIIAALQATDIARIRPQSACTAAAEDRNVVSVDVREYLTDGSGRGTVKVGIADRDKGGKPRVETRTLEVQRDGLEWEVKRAVL
ncbi:MAG: hypothetical protein HOP03_14630 [Lysobacter sp.]|nr:hypothetical protein [Lysobacter sp.]